MHDYQGRPGGLLQADRRRDSLAIGARDDVVLELAGVAVADHRALAVLGDHEVRDVGEASPQHREVGVAQVLRDRLEVAHQRVHRVLALPWNRQRPLPALLEPRQPVPHAAADQLAEEPERQKHDAEQDVGELGSAVQHAVLTLGPCQSLPHGAALAGDRVPDGPRLEAVADGLDHEPLGARIDT